MSDFGKIIKTTIDDKGLTQKWVADRVGTTEATISRYINGKKNPLSIEFLCQMSKALNVSTDYLVGLTPTTETFNNLSPEERILVGCFKRASEDDNDVIWATLRKYMTPNERRYFQQLKNSQAEKIG